MAKQSFEVTFTGWVAQDPMLYTPEDGPEKAVCSLRVLHTPRFRDSAGSWQQGESLAVSVKIWGWPARYAARSISKGDPVIAVGRMARTRWTDKNGEEHFGLELTASSIGHDLTLGEAHFFRMFNGLRKTEPDVLARQMAREDENTGREVEGANMQGGPRDEAGCASPLGKGTSEADSGFILDKGAALTQESA